MSDTINRIENKIDKLYDKMDSTNSTLAKQEVSLARAVVSLEEHVKRTNILESRITPIETSWNRAIGVIKFIGLIAVLGGIVESIILILNFFKG